MSPRPFFLIPISEWTFLCVCLCLFVCLLLFRLSNSLKFGSLFRPRLFIYLTTVSETRFVHRRMIRWLSGRSRRKRSWLHWPTVWVQSWKKMRKPTKNLNPHLNLGHRDYVTVYRLSWHATNCPADKKASFFPLLWNTEVDYLVYNMPSLAAFG